MRNRQLNGTVLHILRSGLSPAATRVVEIGVDGNRVAALRTQAAVTNLLAAVVLRHQSRISHFPNFQRAPFLKIGKALKQKFVPVPVLLIVHPVLLRFCQLPDRFRFRLPSPRFFHLGKGSVFSLQKRMPAFQQTLLQLLWQTGIVVDSEFQLVAELHTEHAGSSFQAIPV